MRINRFVRHILLALITVMAMTACERRSLVDIYKSKTNVQMTVDWSQFNAPVPKTITVLFYPKDGGTPIVVHSNDVNNITIPLPAGDYDVLVYNEDKEHFECYDIDERPTFVVNIANDDDELQPLGVGTATVSVPETDISLDEEPDVSVTVPTVYPHNILWTCNVNVKVGGYQYVNGISAVFTGLASSYGNRSAATEKFLDNWKSNDEEKEFSTTFKCLGLHYSYSARPENNHLKLKFNTSFGDEIERDVLIGNLIKVDNTTNTMNVSLSAIASEIQGGYDVEIEPWDEEESVVDSRADIGLLDNIYTNGFRFSINCSGKELYEGAVASWDGAGFVTNPQMYWPEASETSPCIFRAVSYSDMEGEVLYTTATSAAFDFTTPANAHEQEDVLVASEIATSVPDNGILHLPFTHALTKVNFTVFVDKSDANDGFIWKVSSVSLKAKASGTYIYGEASPWQVAGEPIDMQYLSPEQTFSLQNGQEWVGHNNFMLIPQNGEDVTVTLTWNVYFNNGGALIKMSKHDAKRSYTISTANWRPNASLRYASLRLPNIGEDTDSNDGFDDNKMNRIDYDPIYPFPNQ